eukprot:4353028-Prymnesium_polylepis.3
MKARAAAGGGRLSDAHCARRSARPARGVSAAGREKVLLAFPWQGFHGQGHDCPREDSEGRGFEPGATDVAQHERHPQRLHRHPWRGLALGLDQSVLRLLGRQQILLGHQLAVVLVDLERVVGERVVREADAEPTAVRRFGIQPLKIPRLHR